MSITPRNILRHELIGLECAVSKSRNKRQEGINGTIMDETKNMIIMEKSGKPHRISKADAEFVFTLPDGKRVKVHGSLLVARPENRIRLKIKKW